MSAQQSSKKATHSEVEQSFESPFDSFCFGIDDAENFIELSDEELRKRVVQYDGGIVGIIAGQSIVDLRREGRFDESAFFTSRWSVTASGDGKWIVSRLDTYYLTRDLEEIRLPLPSSQTDEMRESVRFDNVQEAFKAIRLYNQKALTDL